LARHNLFGIAQLPLLQRFAHAQNGFQPGFLRRGEPCRHITIVLTVNGPPLGVAHQDVTAVKIHQHGGGYLTGMRPLGFRIERLTTPADT
jgi:hypothetical protein